MARTRGPIGPAVFADKWLFSFRLSPDSEDAYRRFSADEKSEFERFWRGIVQNSIESRSAKWDPIARTYEVMGRLYRIEQNGLDEIWQVELVGSMEIDDDGNDVVVMHPPKASPQYSAIVGSW